MEIYDTEEAQVEALKRWWQVNSTSVTVGLALGIAIILGSNYWQEYKKQKASEASALFGELQKAADTNKQDAVGKLLVTLKEKYGNTEYVAFGSLIQAKLKVDAGDINNAKEILTGLSTHPDKEISNIAKLRLVRLMLATKEYEQGLQLINAIDPASESSFTSNYDELTGDLYTALDRLDEARTAYQNALRNGHQSPLLQYKIDDLAVAESVKNLSVNTTPPLGMSSSATPAAAMATSVTATQSNNKK